MERPALTVLHLVAAGFRRSGAWLKSDRGIRREGMVPACGGVYAFSVGDRVMYVGLASSNLAKRLYFYGNPGIGQRTNLRLNTVITDCLANEGVDIHFACPPDFQWNGMPVKGAQGLEAGLISRFDLPWNVRGAARNGPVLASVDAAVAVTVDPSTRSVGPFGSAMQRVLDHIRTQPGCTEVEIAVGVFGRGTPQQRANPICRELVKRGLVDRSGSGGVSNPYTYTIRA